MTDSKIEGSYRIDGVEVGELPEEVADALKSLTLGGALDAIAEQARLMVGTHQSAISYIPDGDFARASHATSLSDKYAKYRAYDVMPTGAGIWGVIFETGEPMRFTEEELISHPRWRNFSEMKDATGLEHPPMPGWLAVPVKRPNGEPVGVLQLSDKIEGDFDNQDQELLEQIAMLVTATFEVAYFRDQLERVEQLRAELERSNQELDQFAQVASHDLREPLRGIHNYSQFLIEDYGEKLDDEGRHKLETLMRLAQRMDGLIGTLLRLSRVGRAELVYSQADAGDLARGAVDALHASVEENGTQIEISVDLPALTCDPVLAGQVFQNMISNAIKYWDDETGHVEVGWNGDVLRPIFHVRDDGIGIREKHHESIFGIFKRLHARNKYGGGLGAGLAISKRIVERHGGRIWVESQYGEGSTFYFTLGGGSQE